MLTVLADVDGQAVFSPLSVRVVLCVLLMLEPLLVPSLASVLVTAFPDYFKTCFDLHSAKADFSSPLFLLTEREMRLLSSGATQSVAVFAPLLVIFSEIFLSFAWRLTVHCTGVVSLRRLTFSFIILKKSSRFDKVEFFELIEFAMILAWMAPMCCFTPTSKYKVRKVSEVLRPRPVVIFAAEMVSNCHLK